ncbi:MAG TPA: hypothetical protein DEO41_01485 [Betaproteobacteria bacterium]|nr:hypothetical protein [Betaproteobacteria bacterium]
MAGCSTEIRILGDDLVGVLMPSQQNQLLSDRIMCAKRHCFRGEEDKAIRLINAARKPVGLQSTTGEFDCKNIPIEELIQEPTN